MKREDKKVDNLLRISWYLTLILGIAFGMLITIALFLSRGILFLMLYGYIAIVGIACVVLCVVLIEIIMCIGLKNYTIRAIKKEGS